MSDRNFSSASWSHHPLPSSHRRKRKTGSRTVLQCCISSPLRYLPESSDVEWCPTRYVKAYSQNDAVSALQKSPTNSPFPHLVNSWLLHWQRLQKETEGPSELTVSFWYIVFIHFSTASGTYVYFTIYNMRFFSPDYTLSVQLVKIQSQSMGPSTASRMALTGWHQSGVPNHFFTSPQWYFEQT